MASGISSAVRILSLVSYYITDFSPKEERNVKLTSVGIADLNISFFTIPKFSGGVIPIIIRGAFIFFSLAQ